MTAASAAPAWMTRAACARVPGLPWTTDEHAVPYVLVDEMRAVCGSCPVRLACSSHAAEGVTGGWWAGIDRDPDNDTDRQPVQWQPVYGSNGRLVEEQAVIALDGVA